VAIFASLRSAPEDLEEEVSHAPFAGAFAGLRARRKKDDDQAER
jgi:hypothetical protein